MKKALVAVLLTIFAAGVAGARQRSSDGKADQPTYHVTMVPRTILAINYQNRNKTEIGFQGSPLMPLAKGEAHVESRNGRIAVVSARSSARCEARNQP